MHFTKSIYGIDEYLHKEESNHRTAFFAEPICLWLFRFCNHNEWVNDILIQYKKLLCVSMSMVTTNCISYRWRYMNNNRKWPITSWTTEIHRTCQSFRSFNLLHVKVQFRNSLFAKYPFYATKFLLPSRHYQWHLKEFLLMIGGSYLFHKWFLTQSIVKSINVTQIENLMHYFLSFDTFDKKWNMKWHIDGIQISKQNDVTIAAFDEN